MKSAERTLRVTALPAAHSSLVPHDANRSRTRSRRRLAHSIEQFLEDDRVIVGLVLRAKQQGHAFSLVGKLVKQEQRFLGLRQRQLLQISLAKVLPVIGPRVV